MFESVLFPAPFSPSSACTSPGAASKSTESFASTPGKRFVIPCIATAGEAPGVPAPLSSTARATGVSSLVLARRNLRDAPDHALDQILHRVQVADRRALALPDPDLAGLVLDRTTELVELPGHDQPLVLRDQGLRLGRDLRAVLREAREPVLDRAVVEAGLPGAVHGRLDALQVVRPPVVDRGRQPGLGRELARVRVVADPRNALRLRVLARGRAVHVLPEDVRSA